MFWSWLGRDRGCHDPPTHPCSGGCDGCGGPYPPGTFITCPPQPCPEGCDACEKKPTPPETPVVRTIILPSYHSPKRGKRPVGWTQVIILGFQHYLVMLGTTITISNILARRMRVGNVEKAKLINTSILVAGCNTLFQNFFGARLPVVMGSSFSSLVPTLYIISSRRFLNFSDPTLAEHTIRAVQGAQIIPSLFQIIIGYCSLWKKFARALSPLVKSPLVTHTGLGLFARAFPELAKCIEVGLPELIIAIILSQYIPSMLKVSRRVRGILRRVAVTLSVVIVWAYAAILTAAGAYDNQPEQTQTSCRVDRSGIIDSTPWIKIPLPFQWGLPTFHAGDALAMMVASFVSTKSAQARVFPCKNDRRNENMIEAIANTTSNFGSTGTYTAASSFVGKPMPAYAHIRALVWQRLGSLLNGIFGSGSGPSASVESAGLLGLTGFPRRKVIKVLAGLMILTSIVGKPGAFLASVPLPITAALNCIHYGYVACSGVGLFGKCKKGNRSNFIMGFSLCIGLGVPQYFNGFQPVPDQGPVHTDALWFNTIMQVIFSSPVTVAAFVALFLDCTFPGKATRRRKHNWLPRWKKFKKFYSLPSIDLNRINSFLKWKNLRKFLTKLLKCSDSSSNSEDDENSMDHDDNDNEDNDDDDEDDDSDEDDDDETMIVIDNNDDGDDNGDDE